MAYVHNCKVVVGIKEMIAYISCNIDLRTCRCGIANEIFAASSAYCHSGNRC